MQEIVRPDTSDAAREWRLVSLVCAAHFISHYYILLLPPLFVFVRSDYDVSYTELSFALTVFGIVSSVLQMPAGFLVDRVGARPVLLAGLVIGSVAFLVAGLMNSFWVFVVMFGLAGLGNTAYHPADYALLSHGVSDSRASHAYSAHNFAGMLGGAVAPTLLLAMNSLVGWRGTFVATRPAGDL
jgi:MFS transporter, FSR family, fosmidomycin resistance protein